MNEITLRESDGIYVDKIDVLTANSPFYHVDRIAKTNVLIYVTSGCIYVSEEGIEYTITPGDLILLKQGTHQYGTKLIEAGTSWIYAHFYVGDISNGSLHNISYDHLNQESIILPKFIKGLSETDIPGRLRNLIRTSESNKTLCMNRVSSSFHNILLDIYDHNTPATQYDLSDQILDYLQDNIAELLTSTNLEKRFHLTYKHLARVFSKSTGIGIMQYHTKLKLEAAARELRSSSKAISTISDELGFNDPLYFSKCFRKQYGLSPREYRKQEIILAFES